MNPYIVSSFEIAFFSYLLGSIPFGFLITKIAGLGDIRTIGSGNIGATNVLRTGRKGLAALTLLLDALKGNLAVGIADFLSIQAKHERIAEQLSGIPEKFFYHYEFLPAQWPLIAAFAVVFGHVFPVWLKFRGGKGVATALGTLLALAPWVGVGACLIWLATAFAFRYSSLAALVALLVSPLLAYLIYHDADLAGVCGLIALLVWFRHRANIQRLLAGEEPKIGRKKEAV